MGAMRIALIVLLATFQTSSGTSHRHQAKFLAREPTVKVIDSDAVPLSNEQRQDSVVRITDVSVQKVDDQTPQEQDDIKIEVIGMHTKMVIPGSAPPTMPPDAKEAEKAAMKMFEDMFEAWGGKVPEVSSVKALGKEDRGRLVPFGRQEPKMCISVTVLVPEFTMKDSVTKIIEGRIYKAVEVVGNATQKATATVAATASAKQHAMVQAEATGKGSYNATATAHAEHTAYAEATDQVTASYQASATALAGSPVKENSDVITKAHIKIEAQATSVEKATASATRRANATRSASATVNEGVDVQLSQTGTGEGDAEVSKTASATAEDTETVTKTMKVGSEGVGKLKKFFEASATAQSWVASKACISARKARSLLDSTAMQLHGIPFALAVYNKAHAVAFEKAKGKAAEMALNTAQGAAKRQVERELIAQIQSYAKEHSAELKDLAIEDAVKSTLGQKKQLEAAAMAEAFQLASEKVHKQAPLKATAEAKEEAIKAAKEEATRLATLEARKDASKSLEKKVLQKAMEDAKAKAELSAEAKAQALAKAEAEKIAKDLAVSLAHKAAQAVRFEELAASPQLPQVTGGPPRDSSMKIAMGRATWRCGWSP